MHDNRRRNPENANPDSEHARALARCDQEIARIENTHHEPAWLVAMGWNDWQMEKARILQYYCSERGNAIE